jgi:hypothetical protein
VTPTPNLRVVRAGLHNGGRPAGRVAAALELLLALALGDLVADGARDEEVPHGLAEGAGGAEDEEDEEDGGRAGGEEGEVAFGAVDAQVGFGRDGVRPVVAGGTDLVVDDDQLEDAVIDRVSKDGWGI